MHEVGVAGGDAGEVGRLERRDGRVLRGDPGLQQVGARRCAEEVEGGLGIGEHPGGLVDGGGVPPGAVLVFERDEVSGGVEAREADRLVGEGGLTRSSHTGHAAYPGHKTTASPASVSARELLSRCRPAIGRVLAEFGAVNPRIFASVARGDAGNESDIDIMVDLIADHPRSELVRISGITVGLRKVLGRNVDVFSRPLMKASVSTTALRDAVPL